MPGSGELQASGVTNAVGDTLRRLDAYPARVAEQGRPCRRRATEHTYNADLMSTLLVPARALENGVYVAYANHTGPNFTGLSCIASPYGTFLGMAGHDEELMFADVDPAEVQRAREINTYLTCRRPDLFI